jgi:hypothetical protein
MTQTTHGTCSYHCGGCHQHCSSLASFDAHRQGDYSTGRYCVPPDQVSALAVKYPNASCTLGPSPRIVDVKVGGEARKVNGPSPFRSVDGPQTLPVSARCKPSRQSIGGYCRKSSIAGARGPPRFSAERRRPLLMGRGTLGAGPASGSDGGKHGRRRELYLLRLVAERPKVYALTACPRVA